jgi:1-acyl-sn-glycerol-3-phosphate acyltransferase
MSATSSSVRSGLLGGTVWRVFNVLQLAFTLVWTSILICIALLVLLLGGGRRRWPLRMASRLWAPGLLVGAGVQLELQGFDAIDFSRPHIIVANHQSIIDICVLFRAMPVPLRFVLKQELARVPFVGAYARAMGMVFIERQSARNASRKLHDAAALFREGHSLCAFPEGTRSRDGRVGSFKGGVFKLAIEAGIPVIPVLIEGSGQVLPAAGFSVRPGRIRLCAATPITTSGLDASARQDLAKRSRDAIVGMQHH